MNVRLAAFAAACLLACHAQYGTRSEPQQPASTNRVDLCTLARPDAALFPVTGLPHGLALTESPRGYVGEQLFDLIDGGAVQYFDHGFVWALAGTYEGERGTRITVELYRMGSAEQAGALFQARDVPSAEAVDVGDAARYMTGSVELLCRCCVLTVTSFEPGDEGKEAVMALARRIDQELQG